ncbi:MAG: ABC transporter ATP-binding protein [Sporolactobacillus sp.]|jgi:ABC-2 type transport system ATP-binding protein|nr:ABC transporter ATP-binding protein [Sporolactobacillus sp.]
MNVLQLEGVTKTFGRRTVLKNLNLALPEQTIFGLIGKNGAGKTTTMKMVLGFLRPDKGKIYVCGKRVHDGSARTNQYIGYLPDVPEFYGYMKPLEYLTFCGRIAGMSRRRIRKRAQELLRLVGLCNEQRKINGFSRGMKQRLGIAQALLGNPKLLICDEPTSALDPVGRRELLDILSLASKQTAILFSTHILADVERICDHIAILNDGSIALQGPLADIRHRFRQDIVAIALADHRTRELLAVCQSFPFVTSAAITEQTVTLRIADISQHGPKLLAVLSQKQFQVLKYEVLEPTLEDVFLEVIR